MTLALAFACLVMSSNFSSTTVVPLDLSQQYTWMSVEEQRCVELVNAERWARGLPLLQPDPLLASIAREHSRDMAEHNYFDHYSNIPGKRTAGDRFISAYGRCPRWACIGENLFYCSIVDVNRGHTAFMGSPSHRDNILSAKYEKIGVGTYKDSSGQFWVTQMFASVRD